MKASDGGWATVKLEIGWDCGVVIRNKESAICLDPQNINTPYKHIFISHAHRDHTAGFMAKGSEKYSNPATASIFEATTGREIIGLKTLSYGERVKVDGFEITAYNAGHILGSTLYRVDTGEGTIVYTGDINCIDTMVTRAAEEIPCDVLVMESTYGSPDFRFPPRDQIYRSLVEWVVSKVREGATPTFYVYPVGKSQEIISVLNHFTEIPVIVDPQIAKVNEVYARSRIKLDATVDGGGSSQPRPSCVVVKPHLSYDPSGLEPGVIPVMASGWAVRFRYRNVIFPLSSHADFYQLTSYVNRVKPKIVYTSFGLSDELAGHIRRRLGGEARPLKPLSKELCLHDHGLG